jgi:hypothetical protein
MRLAISLLDVDVREAGGSEDEIGIIDPILFAIGHANGERLKRSGVEEVANALFQISEYSAE